MEIYIGDTNEPPIINAGGPGGLIFLSNPHNMFLVKPYLVGGLKHFFHV